MKNDKTINVTEGNMLVNIVKNNSDREQAYLAIRHNGMFESWSDQQIDNYLNTTSKFKKTESAPIVPVDNLKLIKVLFNDKIKNLSSLDELGERHYLVKKLEIEVNTLVSLVGSGESTKSWFLMYILLSVAHNKNLFNDAGWAVKHLENVCFVDNERGLKSITRRLNRLKAGLGLQDLNINRITLDLISYDSVKKYGQQPFVDELADVFKKYDVIGIDSFSRLFAYNENDNNEAKTLAGLLKMLCDQHNKTILFIHHAGKSNIDGSKHKGRGASSLFDAVDQELYLSLDKQDKVVEVMSSKNNDNEHFDTIYYKLQNSDSYNKMQQCSDGITLQLQEKKLMDWDNLILEIVEELKTKPLLTIDEVELLIIGHGFSKKKEELVRVRQQLISDGVLKEGSKLGKKTTLVLSDKALDAVADIQSKKAWS